MNPADRPESSFQRNFGPIPRRRRLLFQFLLILVPLFLLLAVPGVTALVHYTLDQDRAALSVRLGNLAGRVASSLARYDPAADRQVVRDLMSSLSSDRALICAELVRSSDGSRVVSHPARIGCQGREAGQLLEIPVGLDEVHRLSVRFSDSEIEEANALQVVIALGVICIAFLVAVLTSVAGFQYIVNRPLQDLLKAIEYTSGTGERRFAKVRTRDELGIVIDAFNALQQRDLQREEALDVTNQRLYASQEELIRANRALTDSNRAKSQFLANMSHELRTPLNAIIGFSQIIMEGKDARLTAEDYREYGSDILAGGEHLLEVITDILDISMVESGRMELHEQECDFEEIVTACMRLMRERTEIAGVELRRESFAPGVVLWADARICKQMLINLLSNAVKFTESAGSITVRDRLDSSGDFLLTVADSGVGISPDDLVRIVEPFYQVDGSLQRRHQGTGLGLPLVKEFAEMHGGSIHIESEIGVGTTVTIRLPAERVITPVDAIRQALA